MDVVQATSDTVVAINKIAADHDIALTSEMTNEILVILGVAKSEREIAFEAYSWKIGLKPSDLGKEFIYQGNIWTIVGLARGGTSSPVLAKNQNGYTYGLNPKDVKHGLDEMK